MTRDALSLRGGGIQAGEALCAASTLGCCPSCTEAPGLTAVEYQQLSLREALCTRCCARRFLNQMATHPSLAAEDSPECLMSKDTSSSALPDEVPWTGSEQQTMEVSHLLRPLSEDTAVNPSGPEAQARADVTPLSGSPSQGAGHNSMVRGSTTPDALILEAPLRWVPSLC
jgi:hypothetical protein